MNSAQTAFDIHALKCEMADEVLRSSGSLRLQVQGWSMLPSVLPGDILTIERVSAEEVAEGDIVLFGRDRRLVVHRVIGRTGDSGNSSLITRGDAMATPDPVVDEKQLLGRVTFIMRNGKCIEPPRTMGAPARAVAALVQRSEIAARVVVGIHGLRQASQTK